MNQKELAEALNISPAMVSKLAKRGMPVDSLERAQRWRKRHLEPGRVKASSIGAATAPSIATRPPAHAPLATMQASTLDTTEATPEPTLAEDDPGGEDFLTARTRREVAEANLAELKLAEQQGAVIQVEAVRAAWAKRLASTRDALLQIPSRLAPLAAAESNMETVALLIEREIRQALDEMSRGNFGGET